VWRTNRYARLSLRGSRRPWLREVGGDDIRLEMPWNTLILLDFDNTAHCLPTIQPTSVEEKTAMDFYSKTVPSSRWPKSIQAFMVSG